MANFDVFCFECKNIVTANVSDTIHNNLYRWHLSYKCKICDNAIEFDDIGELPDEIKRAIIEQEGLWGAILSNRKELKKLSFYSRKDSQIMSEIADLELTEAGVTDMFFKGTKNEVMWLISKLSKKGIESIKIKMLT